MKICDMGIPKDKCSFTDFGEVFGRCPGSVTIRKTFLGLVFLRALYINNTSRKPPAVPPLPAGMKANLLLKKILGIAESMEFEEYQRIIENILHKTHLHPKMQEQLRQISTRQFTATFLNGKPLGDPIQLPPLQNRKKTVCRLNRNSLLPVLGGISAPRSKHITSLTKIPGFVQNAGKLEPL
ncbi:repeat element 8 protein [Diadegma fenestrale ichnovirus]|nr:repeat element 8 protein [Diadegma fenestrale ichnovirus]